MSWFVESAIASPELPSGPDNEPGLKMKTLNTFEVDAKRRLWPVDAVEPHVTVKLRIDHSHSL
jgi:hypothetical protein